MIDVKEMIEGIGGKVTGYVDMEDGSGFMTASFPLPKDHWLYEDKENVIPKEPLGASCYHVRLSREAAKYAIRASTMNGKDMDFDPDAMVQNFVNAMCGYQNTCTPVLPDVYDGVVHAMECIPGPVPSDTGAEDF